MNFTIPTADGHNLPCYQALPNGTPKGGVALFHEAFGVTPHIRDMADALAADGYHVLAPEMFARAEADPAKRILPYNKDGLEQGRRYILATPREEWLLDTSACVTHLHGQGVNVATMGYCWGGSLAYLTACKVPQVGAAVCYYGGMLAELVAAMQPACPVQFHLAEHDRYIPVKAATGAIRTHLPQASLYVYDADHGFNRNGGATYDAAAAHTARARTAAFLAENIGK